MTIEEIIELIYLYGEAASEVGAMRESQSEERGIPGTGNPKFAKQYKREVENAADLAHDKLIQAIKQYKEQK